MTDDDGPPAPDPSEPNPGRFLGMLDDGGLWVSSSAKQLALARIRGIDYMEVLDEFYRSAEILELVPDDEEIVRALNERRVYLREHGDRPERLGGERTPAPQKPEVVFLDEDGNPRSEASRSYQHRGYSKSARRSSSGSTGGSSGSSTDSSTQDSLTAFADGGVEE